VVIALASVLAPNTTRLDVPVEFVIEGLVPPILRLPTFKALFCRSKVALLSVSNELLLPRVPVLVRTIVPPLMVVAPPKVFAPESLTVPA
jgi:hypothetical protein